MLYNITPEPSSSGTKGSTVPTGSTGITVPPTGSIGTYALPPKIALRASNGKYCNYNKNGNKEMACDSNEIGRLEQFTVENLGEGKYAFKSSEGKYCMNHNGQGENNKMYCSSESIGSWEKFIVEYIGNNQIALKGNTGKYCKVIENDNKMYCTSDSIGITEKFTVETLIEGTTIPFVLPSIIALKGWSGKYCNYNFFTREMACRSNEIGRWEKFSVENLGEGKYAFKSSEGKYCLEHQGENNKMSCRSNEIGPWEKFSVEYIGNNQIALKGHTGKYCLEHQGENNQMSCRSNEIGPWEKFTFETLSFVLPPKIALKGSNGKYCNYNKNGNKEMACDSNEIGKLEEFTVEYIGNNQIKLKYCMKNEMSCTIDSHEQFTVEYIGNNQIALKGQSGKYCKVGGNDNKMYCTSDSIGPWEKFIVIKVNYLN